MHSAIKPVPRTDRGWTDRAKLLNERVKETQDTQLIFIGDSITHGWEGEGKDVWQKYYASRKAINLGIGGDRTQHVLYRLENGNLDGIQPKAAVVMIGTNNSNGEDNTPGQIADGVRAIIKTLRAKLPNTKIILLAIFPRGENFNPQRGKNAQVNQILQKLDDNKNVFFMDIGHRFLNEDGLLPSDIMPDYLHLTKKGYEIWAQAIEARLARIIENKPSARAAVKQVDPSGEWLMRIRPLNEDEIETPMILKAEEGRLTGKIAAGEDRWLEIQEGKISGNQCTFIVRQNRDDGSVVVYKSKAKIEADAITGSAQTEVDGKSVTIEWKATRK
jgi:beta-glucosidase